jgi:hypothetical protein
MALNWFKEKTKTGFVWILELFGYGSAEDQTERTDAAIRWAFLIGLVFSLFLIPYPVNIVVFLVVVAWLIGWLRHHVPKFNWLWNKITLGE